MYAWLRKGAGQTILCVMNTQNTAHKKFPLYFQYPCAADELLNSEAACWNGAVPAAPDTCTPPMAACTAGTTP